MSPCAATIYIQRAKPCPIERATWTKAAGKKEVLSLTPAPARIKLVFFNVTKGSYIYGAFTLDVKSVLNENLGGILGGTQC
jgi:hypothetical protein